LKSLLIESKLAFAFDWFFIGHARYLLMITNGWAAGWMGGGIVGNKYTEDLSGHEKSLV